MDIENLKEILENKETEILEYSNEEQWHELRRIGIGGSDIGAILGVNKYRSKLDVYLDKTEGKRFEGNEYTYWGKQLEPIIRNRFEEEHKEDYKVFTCNKTLKYGSLIGNVDGMVYNIQSKKYGVLEIKTSNVFNINEWTNGTVPSSYYAQVQHYLAITGFSFGIIVVLIGGSQYKEFCVERNEDDINLILNSSNSFIEDYIKTNKMPEPDGSDSYTEYQLKKFNKIQAGKETIALDEELEEELIKREDNKEKIKELEIQNKQIEQNIMKIMLNLESEKAESDKFKVSIITQNRNRINKKEFENKYKELIEEFKGKEEEFKEKIVVKFLKIIGKEVM